MSLNNFLMPWSSAQIKLPIWLIGLILGPMAEVQLRRALQAAQGDPMALVSTPLSATLMVIAALIVIVPAALHWRRTRKIVEAADAE